MTALAGIGDRAARAALAACFNGGLRRGQCLVVRQVNASGGPGGIRYDVGASCGKGDPFLRIGRITKAGPHFRGRGSMS